MWSGLLRAAAAEAPLQGLCPEKASPTRKNGSLSNLHASQTYQSNTHEPERRKFVESLSSDLSAAWCCIRPPMSNVGATPCVYDADSSILGASRLVQTMVRSISCPTVSIKQYWYQIYLHGQRHTRVTVPKDTAFVATHCATLRIL